MNPASIYLFDDYHTMLEKKKIIAGKTKDKEFTLPVSYTTVYQSNRLTNANFQGFGLMHIKIFIAILKSLQEAIRAEMNGLDWQQMKLFEEPSKDNIQVKLFLKEITTANHYPEVVKAAKDIMGLIIKLKKSNKEGYISFRTLFTGVDAPIRIEGKAVLIVHVLKDVANQIIAMDKNKNGQTINFTKFFYETAMSSTSKYTARLYMLICSWRIKGGFYVTIDGLKEMLDIGKHEYKNFSDFKKRILVPAQNELKKKGDCWFNTAENGFENKNGKRVIGLNFKVITKQTVESDKLKYDNLRNILKMHIGFKDKDLETLKPVLEQTNKFGDISFKIMYLRDKKTDEHGKPIVNKISYISSSLIKEFWPNEAFPIISNI